jgi:hypothetical protein
MDFDYTLLASARSDQELTERVDNRQKYMPETVEASLAELQHRGKEFSDEELRYINEDMQARRRNAALITGRIGIFNSDYKYAIVEDPDAPLMYTRVAIYVFAVLFGALFGSIMMAINIAKTGRNNAVAGVILFGVGFTIVQVYVLNSMPNPSGSLSIVFAFISAFCLDYLFWKPYIGYSSFYRSRPIWVPLIIGVILAALLVFAMVSGIKK